MNHSVVLWTYINYYSKYYSKSKSYCVYYCVLDIVYYYYDRHTYIHREKERERERHSSPPLKIKTIKKSCNIPFFSFPSTVISYISCFTLSLFRKCYWIIIIPPPWKKTVYLIVDLLFFPPIIILQLLFLRYHQRHWKNHFSTLLYCFMQFLV